jgi:hypothetical protein
MSKKAIGIIIMALVFLFPFRWVYLEYPEAKLVNTTMVDSGGAKYAILFLSVVLGVLAFYLLSNSDSSKEKANH